MYWTLKLIKMNKNENEILSLSEATEFLKLSKSCIYKLTSKKEIPHFVPGGKKIYFQKSDLEDWVLKNRIPSASELEANTEIYLSNPLKITNHD